MREQRAAAAAEREARDPTDDATAGSEPAVRWWQQTLGGGGVSDHGHWAVANHDTVFTVAGVSAEELVAVDLTTGQERWRTPIGGRWSGLPQLATDDLVLVAAQYETVQALDTATGNTVWQLELDGGYGAATAALVDDSSVLLVANSHQEGDYRPPLVLSVDLTDGTVRWQTPLRPGESAQWAAPVVIDGRAIVATSPDGEQQHSAVHALEIATGELVWTRDVGPQRQYTSYTEADIHTTGDLVHLPIPGPATITLTADTGTIVWETDGVRPLGGTETSLIMTDGQAVYSVDPTTGELLVDPRPLPVVDKIDWLIGIDTDGTVLVPTIDGIAILDPTSADTIELHPTGVAINRIIHRGDTLIIATQDRGVLAIDLDP